MASSEIEEYKYVLLIAADKAQELGIEAESPVWVSPRIKGNMMCPVKGCGTGDKPTIYSPLVYQTSQIVKAHHFHPNADAFNSFKGGIYFYDASQKIRNTSGQSIALLTSHARVPINYSNSTFIASEVRVDAIRVACEMRSLKWSFFAGSICDDSCPPWLEQGVLVGDQESNLFPVHSREVAARLFQIGYKPSGLAFHALSDGSVVFSTDT